MNFAPGSSKSSQFYDSSGIGSMAPSAFSATSSLDYKDRRQHRKAPTPKKHSKIGKNLSNLITISYLGKVSFFYTKKSEKKNFTNFFLKIFLNFFFRFSMFLG